MHAALSALVPPPALKTRCGKGFGMAACPALGLLVTSDDDKNTLSVFDLSHNSGAGAGAGAGLALVCTLGGAFSPAPMKFKFSDGNCVSGWMEGKAKTCSVQRDECFATCRCSGSWQPGTPGSDFEQRHRSCVTCTLCWSMTPSRSQMRLPQGKRDAIMHSTRQTSRSPGTPSLP